MNAPIGNRVPSETDVTPLAAWAWGWGYTPYILQRVVKEHEDAAKKAQELAADKF